jgi:hypothetical protein
MNAVVINERRGSLELNKAGYSLREQESSFLFKNWLSASAVPHNYRGLVFSFGFYLLFAMTAK